MSSVALSNFYQKMALISLNNFCLELLNATEPKRVTRPVLGFKSFQAAQAIISGIELLHMIRKGQFMTQGCARMSFSDQFYALAGQVRPK